MPIITVEEFENLWSQRRKILGENLGQGFAGKWAYDLMKQHEFELELNAQGIVVKDGPITFGVEKDDPELYEDDASD